MNKRSAQKIVGALVRERLIVLVVLLVVSGSFLGYALYTNKPSASSLTTATTTPTVKLPAEFGQVQKLNSQIDDAINSGSENTVCSLLATRSPLLQAAISQSPDKAQGLLFDSSTIASIDPMPCAANTVEQPNTTIAGNVQVGIVDLLDNASTAPEETYALTSSDNKLYSVSFSDYNKPTANLPQTGQTISAKGTLIDQTLLAASQGVTITNRATRAEPKSQLGVHKLLVLFFTFPDSPTPSPYSLTDPTFQAKVKTDFLANQTYWNQATWGQIKFQGQNASDAADYKFVSVGVAPVNSATCVNRLTASKTFAWLSSLPAFGISSYDNVVAFAPFSPDCTAYSGVTNSIPGKFTIIQGSPYATGDLYPQVISHEIGHQLGLYHGASYTYPCFGYPNKPTYGRLNCDPTSDAYGDTYNMMGAPSEGISALLSSPNYPTTDLPGIDKQVLGVLPPASSGSANLAGLNTAGNPLIVKLYSLEANPSALPPGSYQHFEVSSSLTGPAAITPKIDIEFRPNLPIPIGGKVTVVLFHIVDPVGDSPPTSNPNKTYILNADSDSDIETISPGGGVAINNMYFELSDITGSVATVKITERPDLCDVAPKIVSLSPATLVIDSKNPRPVIAANYQVISQAPTGCTGIMRISSSIDYTKFPSNLDEMGLTVTSTNSKGGPVSSIGDTDSIVATPPDNGPLDVTVSVRFVNQTNPLSPVPLGPLPPLILTAGSCGT